MPAPFLRAVYSVQTDFRGPALTHDLDGIAVRYTYYFAGERVGLEPSGLRR
jgi:hypothetical protein